MRKSLGEEARRARVRARVRVEENLMRLGESSPRSLGCSLYINGTHNYKVIAVL